MISSWLICIVMTAATATDYHGPDSTTASRHEVTVHYLRTNETGSSITDPVEEVGETPSNDLGALLDAGDGAMVSLVAGDTRLAAHRAVLAARSPVFAAMLRRDSSGQIAIPDVEGPALRQLLAYMYTWRAPQLRSMDPQLLATAVRYGVPALKAELEQQLAAQLSVETAAATAVLAIRHSCTSLRQAAVAYIKAHIFQVLSTRGWADAMRSQPEDLVNLSQLLSDAPAETRSLYEEKGRKLIQAAQRGAAEEIEALLDSGADVGARDEEKMTALHWAARRGHVEAVRRLLEGGAWVDARNSSQGTPLSLAAYNGHVAVMRLLLAAFADPNARDQNGWTPLHYAADGVRAEAATLLLQAGADRAARDDRGETPLDIASKYVYEQDLKDILR